MFAICKFVIKHNPNFWLESERPIPVFGDVKKGNNKLFKPDFELKDRKSGQSTCIIEVKKLLEKKSEKYS